MVSGRRIVRLLAITGAALAVSGCGSPVAHNVIARVSPGQAVASSVSGLGQDAGRLQIP
jgi:hypothetical protein